MPPSGHDIDLSPADDTAETAQRQRQGLLNRNQRQNHHLRLRGGVATPAQLAVTEHALAILLRMVSTDHPSSGARRMRPEIRGGLAARLMIDLGRNARQLAELGRIHLERETDLPPAGWGLVSWQAGTGLRFGWWLKAGVHTLPTTGATAEEARGAVWLPVLARTWPWLELAHITPATAVVPHLIGSNPKAIAEDFRAFVRWAGRALGSLSRAIPEPDALAASLVDRLAWQPTGDRALACQISGRDMTRSAARSHYTRVPAEKAAHEYLRGISSPPADASLSWSRDGHHALAMPAFARSAATLKGQKPCVATVRAILELQDRRLDRRRDIAQEHAALVARVWLALALATAARGVTRWVPGASRLEPRTGALLVLDKDRASTGPAAGSRGNSLGSALGRARLVFVHPVVRALLEQYVDHLRALALRKDLHASSRALVERHVASLEAGGLVPFLEIVRDRTGGKLMVREIGPSWLQARFLDQLGEDLTPNFARHALRSGLAGRVPQPALDALLGHFDHGTEPWTNGSALDPVPYRAILHAVFEAHFSDVASFENRR